MCPKCKSRYWNVAKKEDSICANDSEPRLPYQMDCATGSVRKLRRGVPDDGKCGTCPYFEAKT